MLDPSKLPLSQQIWVSDTDTGYIPHRMSGKSHRTTKNRGKTGNEIPVWRLRWETRDQNPHSAVPLIVMETNTIFPKIESRRSSIP
mmetsp:Transcript_32060/g.32328  ORF Transcript_32060/g.32328 Transcript_32060/m.32328 type:complete len:86 (+) Transcript_32060:265-522(+)